MLFATLFGYLWYNGGWGGLFLPLRGWYHNSSYQTVHEQTFTDPVQSLDLRWNGGDVSIRSSSSSEIKIVQKGAQKRAGKSSFSRASHHSSADGVLTVTDGSTTAGLAIGPFPFSIGSDLEVYLPEETYDALSLETTDGDLFFEALQAERLEVRTQSGDAETLRRLSGIGFCLPQRRLSLPGCHCGTVGLPNHQRGHGDLRGSSARSRPPARPATFRCAPAK